MAEENAAQSVVMTNEELAAKERSLDLRLKELEIADKEYEQQHKPSAVRSGLTNPAVIAAAIAAWASLTAAGVTWLSGQIAATQQIVTSQDERKKQALEAQFQREAEERKFEANLITEAVKAKDANQAATNLQFLIDTGLLRGELLVRVSGYLQNRQPGDGKVTLPH